MTGLSLQVSAMCQRFQIVHLLTPSNRQDGRPDGDLTQLTCRTGVRFPLFPGLSPPFFPSPRDSRWGHAPKPPAELQPRCLGLAA